MLQRDANDRNREVAPAVAAPDAVLFDNSFMTPDECTEALQNLVREHLGARSI